MLFIVSEMIACTGGSLTSRCVFLNYKFSTCIQARNNCYYRCFGVAVKPVKGCFYLLIICTAVWFSNVI